MSGYFFLFVLETTITFQTPTDIQTTQGHIHTSEATRSTYVNSAVFTKGKLVVFL